MALARALPHAVSRATRVTDDKSANEEDQARTSCLVFFVQTLVSVMRYYDEDDPKRPRPVNDAKKREGWAERGESRKDNERDHHRHVHVRC